jgi:uncharacterized Zn-binding protein involved in type VI secretion
MPGSPVTIGASVMITPGAAGPPDMGTIINIFPPAITVNGMPLATAGSLCLMVNSVSGVTYPLTIGLLGSVGVTVGGYALVRMGDRIPTPPGILTIIGPPAAFSINDNNI